MDGITFNKCAELLKEAGLLIAENPGRCGKNRVKNLTYVSGQANPGTLFLCKGAAFKREYLQEALERGAFGYVSEHIYEIDPSVPVLLVRNIRKAMPILAKAFYGNADEALKLIGITGTKGKTTVSYYTKAILDAYLKAGKKKDAGLISTIATYDGVSCQESKLTTPEAMEVFRCLNNGKESGMEYMVMEISSQALKYHRVRNIHFEVGVFLNIAEDHISPNEHCDFEDYFNAKLSIFRQTETACINLDANCADKIAKAARLAKRVITFGTKGEPDLLGHDIRFEGEQVSFRVTGREFSRQIKLAMPGVFNVENALAAIAVAYSLGIPDEYMQQGLAGVRVEGRMETYKSYDGKVTAIVDFAHNRLSFERLFDTIIQEYPGHKIISIFGCPGDKAYNRRKELGLLAGLYSSKIYLVPDDPGTESPAEIAGEIEHYAEVVGCPCEYFERRELAIDQAISQAHENTVVLVLGKGNEKQQKGDGVSYPYEGDAAHVLRNLNSYEGRTEKDSVMAG